jgi:hypothetical protein
MQNDLNDNLLMAQLPFCLLAVLMIITLPMYQIIQNKSKNLCTAFAWFSGIEINISYHFISPSKPESH